LRFFSGFPCFAARFFVLALIVVVFVVFVVDVEAVRVVVVVVVAVVLVAAVVLRCPSPDASATICVSTPQCSEDRTVAPAPVNKKVPFSSSLAAPAAPSALPPLFAPLRSSAAGAAVVAVAVLAVAVAVAAAAAAAVAAAEESARAAAAAAPCTERSAEGGVAKMPARFLRQRCQTSSGGTGLRKAASSCP